MFTEFYRHPTRHLYILAKDLIGNFEKETKITTRILSIFIGSELEGLMYRSAMFNDLAQPFIEANYVTTAVGTGLVHISYAHGLNDFKVICFQLLVDIILDIQKIFHLFNCRRYEKSTVLQ